MKNNWIMDVRRLAEARHLVPIITVVFMEGDFCLNIISGL